MISFFLLFRSFLSRRSLGVVVAGMVAAPALILAQQESAGVFHSFTDKQGRSLEARIVSVSPDRRTMSIAQKDGQSFDLEIIKLSLDDQQYLRDWIATQPALSSFRLEVELEKASADTSDRRRYGDYRLVTEHLVYRIKIKNVSRESVTNPTLEYFLLKSEGVLIYQDEDTGEWAFRRNYDDEAGPEMIHEVKKLENLVYNREVEVTTKPAEVDQVFGDGNLLYSEDRLVGVIVQVRDDFGNVIGTYRHGESVIKDMSWESLTGEKTATTASSPVASSPGALEGTAGRRRELDEMTLPLKQGDFVASKNMPPMHGKPIKMSAFVEMGGSDAKGTILACGGKNRGVALVVVDGELQAWTRRINPSGKPISSRVSTPLSDLPSEEFLVEVTWTRDRITLSVNGQIKTEGNSIGAPRTKPSEGVSVGFDSEVQSVGPAPPPDEFTGAIRELEFTVGD